MEHNRETVKKHRKGRNQIENEIEQKIYDRMK